MFIINPKTQGVLTLKPDMKIKENQNNSIISWTRPTFVHEKDVKTEFLIDKKYDELIADFKSNKLFIISQWKEKIK